MFRILFAVVLLAIGFIGGVGCCLSFVALQQMVAVGTPVTCPLFDMQFKLPGRFVAVLMVGIPTLAVGGAAWLLLTAFRKEDEHEA